MAMGLYPKYSFHQEEILQDIKKSTIVLTPEAKEYVAAGASAEIQFLNAVPLEGASVKSLQVCIRASIVSTEDACIFAWNDCGEAMQC